MNAEFNWWLLIVGLVVGAGLVWLVIGDWSRREEDLSEDERAAESAWIAETLSERGEPVDPGAAEEILAMHRAYLRATGMLDLPPDAPDESEVDEFEQGDPAFRAPDDDAEPDWSSTDPARGWAPTAAATESEADIDAPLIGDPRAATGGRPSVRSAPLSPRGSRPPEFESEPPA